jgi:phage-related protein
MNGFDAGSVIAHITADISGFQNGITKAQGLASNLSGGLKSVNSALGGLTAAAGIATAAIGAGLVVAVKTSLDAWKEQEAAIVQQIAVLKSTGNAAGKTTVELQKYATALSRITPYADEAIMAGQNLLLTFTNIKGDKFDQATQTILDMSTALGQDLKSSAIQVGKALQDPILGVTALRRVGVNFSKANQDMIKSLVEAGKTEEAQAFILKELQTEFGGSAKAAGGTFGGQITILKNNIGELQEGFGQFMTQALTPLAYALNKLLSNIDIQGFFDNLTTVILTLFDALKSGDVGTLATELQGIVSPSVIQFLQDFVTNARAFSAWVSENRVAIISFLEGMAVALGALTVIGVITSLLVALTNPITLIVLAVGLLFAAWNTNFLGIRDITKTVLDYIKNLFEAHKEELKAIWDAVINVIKIAAVIIMEIWKTYGTGIINVVQGAFNIVAGFIRIILGTISGIINAFVALVSGDWVGFWDALRVMAKTNLDAVQQIFKGAIQAIIGIIENLFPNFTATLEKIWNKAKEMAEKIRHAISDAFNADKKNSPSINDRLGEIVKSAQGALGSITIPNFSHQISASLGGINGAELSGVGVGGLTLNVNLDGALISDEAGAQRISEIVGNNIVKKLQQNVRF